MVSSVPQSRSYDAHLQLRDIMMARALFVPILFLAAALSQAQTGPVMGAIAGAADNWSASEFGLARGSIFTIYGTNLAPSVASASRLPRPKSLNGVTVTISTNNQFVSAPLLYVSPHQINAILPSAVQEGLQIVYVDVNGVQSGAGSILVLTSRFAAFTHSQLGFGPAVLQQYNKSGVSLNGLMHPAVPGQALVLWVPAWDRCHQVQMPRLRASSTWATM